MPFGHGNRMGTCIAAVETLREMFIQFFIICDVFFCVSKIVNTVPRVLFHSVIFLFNEILESVAYKTFV